MNVPHQDAKYWDIVEPDSLVLASRDMLVKFEVTRTQLADCLKFGKSYFCGHLLPCLDKVGNSGYDVTCKHGYLTANSYLSENAG